MEYLTEEEHIARAMLLNGEPWPLVVRGTNVYRCRLGPSFAGCAWFEYRDTKTLEIVVPRRSELDRTVAEVMENTGGN
jgi:hypothetical protein